MYPVTPDRDRLTHYQRPDGRFYKAKTPPMAHLLENDGDITHVLVIRTDDYLYARNLAQFELEFGYSPDYKVVNPRFGWWRKAMRNNEDYWDYDEIRGACGYMFSVKEK